jgi:hypothetical protein
VVLRRAFEYTKGSMGSVASESTSIAGRDEHEANVRAFDALGKSARLGDMVSIARAVLTVAAEARRVEWADAAKVQSLAEDAKLTHEEAMTPFGDALAVIERGPEDDAERALACALWAHVLAESPPKGRDEEDRAASDLLWLAAHTPFDATGLLDRALGDGAADLWDAIADRVRRIDQGKLAALGRGEALVGAAALALSSSASATRHAASLAAEARDPKLARVLAGGASSGEDEKIVGELTAAPRGPVATAALALTGILFVMHAAQLVARLALAYKRPAEIVLSDKTVRVRYKTQMLGRTLGDRDVVIQRAGLVRATREVRYPRAAFYAGLLALAVGSYFGVATLVDGVRAASPSLLLTGLVIVALGIGLDFAFASIAPGARGRCRVLFVPRDGQKLCVGGVDTKRADAAIARIAHAA